MPWNNNSLRKITEKQIRTKSPKLYKTVKGGLVDNTYQWLNTYDKQFYLRPIAIIGLLIFISILTTLLPNIFEINNAADIINARLSNIAVTISFVLSIAFLLINQSTEKNDIVINLILKQATFYFTIYFSISTIIFLGTVSICFNIIPAEDILPATILSFIIVFGLIIRVFGGIIKILKKGKILDFITTYLYETSLNSLYTALIEIKSKHIFEDTLSQYYSEYKYGQKNILKLSNESNTEGVIYDINLDKIKKLLTKDKLKDKIFYYKYSNIIGRRTYKWHSPIFFISEEAKTPQIVKKYFAAIKQRKAKEDSSIQEILEIFKEKILDSYKKKQFELGSDALDKIGEFFDLFIQGINDAEIKEEEYIYWLLYEYMYVLKDILEEDVLFEDTVWYRYNKERDVLTLLQDIAITGVENNSKVMVHRPLALINGSLIKSGIKNQRDIEIFNKTDEIYFSIFSRSIQSKKASPEAIVAFFRNLSIFLIIKAKNLAHIRRNSDNIFNAFRDDLWAFRREMSFLLRNEIDHTDKIVQDFKTQYSIEYNLCKSAILIQSYLYWPLFNSDKEGEYNSHILKDLIHIGTENAIFLVSEIILNEKAAEDYEYSRWEDDLVFRTHNSLTNEIRGRGVYTKEKLLLFLTIKAIKDGVNENIVIKNNIQFFFYHYQTLKKTIESITADIEYSKKILGVSDENTIFESVNRLLKIFKTTHDRCHLQREIETHNKTIPKETINYIIEKNTVNVSNELNIRRHFKVSTDKQNLQPIELMAEFNKAILFYEKDHWPKYEPYITAHETDKDIWRSIEAKIENKTSYSPGKVLDAIANCPNVTVLTSVFSIDKIKGLDIEKQLVSIETGKYKYFINVNNSKIEIETCSFIKSNKLLIFDYSQIKVDIEDKPQDISIMPYFKEQEFIDHLKSMKERDPAQFEELYSEEIFLYEHLNRYKIVFKNGAEVSILNGANITLFDFAETIKEESITG